MDIIFYHQSFLFDNLLSEKVTYSFVSRKYHDRFCMGSQVQEFEFFSLKFHSKKIIPRRKDGFTLSNPNLFSIIKTTIEKDYGGRFKYHFII